MTTAGFAACCWAFCEEHCKVRCSSTFEACEGGSCSGLDDDSNAESCLNALGVQRNDAVDEDWSPVLTPGWVRYSGPGLVLLGLCSPENCWIWGRATVICLSGSFFSPLDNPPKEEKVLPSAALPHACSPWAHLQNKRA